MEYDFSQLHKMYLDFYDEEIDEASFKGYVNDIYLDILNGGFIEIEKLKLYPIIKMILNLFEEGNDKSDVEADKRYIYEMINGKRDVYFSAEISLPESLFEAHQDDPMFEYIKRWQFKRIYEKILLCEDELVYQKYISLYLSELRKNNKVITLMHNIENSIIAIMESVYDETFLGKGKWRIYPIENEENSIKSVLLEHLKCYIGMKSFNVLIKLTKRKNDVRVII